MIYAIQAQVTWVEDGWKMSKGIPTFFLDSGIQGIMDTEHAGAIAKNMLEPTEQFTAHVTVVECPNAVITRSLYEENTNAQNKG